MRTAAINKQNLQLNLSGVSHYNMLNSSNEDLSVPITPLGQVVSTPTTMSNNNPFVLRRLNSVSSTGAGSDDEDPSNPQNLVTDSSWPQYDDDLVMKVYYEYVDNPTVAPFAGRIPPSGIVNRVARDTTKQAKLEGRHFPHTLSAVRKRLLLLCNRQEAQVPRPPSRTNSTSPFDQQQSQFMTPRRGSESPFDPPMSASNMLNLWWNSSRSSQNPTPPPTLYHQDRPLASPFHDTSTNTNFSSQTIATPEQSPSSHIRQPTPLRGGPPPPLDDFEDLNVTSKRKRDSLKLKRGINN